MKTKTNTTKKKRTYNKKIMAGRGVLVDKKESIQSNLSVNSVIIDDPIKEEAVNNPNHYGGADNPYEVIKVIEAWGLCFPLGNVVKYIARAGKKDPSKELEDLKKAQWYVQRKIEELEKKRVEKIEFYSKQRLEIY